MTKLLIAALLLFAVPGMGQTLRARSAIEAECLTLEDKNRAAELVGWLQQSAWYDNGESIDEYWDRRRKEETKSRLGLLESRIDSLEARRTRLVSQFNVMMMVWYNASEKIDSLEAKLARAHIVSRADTVIAEPDLDPRTLSFAFPIGKEHGAASILFADQIIGWLILTYEISFELEEK